MPLEMFNPILEQLIACVAYCCRFIGLTFSLILMLMLRFFGLCFFYRWLFPLIIILWLLLWILRRYNLLLLLVSIDLLLILLRLLLLAVLAYGLLVLLLLILAHLLPILIIGKLLSVLADELGILLLLPFVLLCCLTVLVFRLLNRHHYLHQTYRLYLILFRMFWFDMGKQASLRLESALTANALKNRLHIRCTVHLWISTLTLLLSHSLGLMIALILL